MKCGESAPGKEAMSMVRRGFDFRRARSLSGMALTLFLALGGAGLQPLLAASSSGPVMPSSSSSSASSTAATSTTIPTPTLPTTTTSTASKSGTTSTPVSGTSTTAVPVSSSTTAPSTTTTTPVTTPTTTTATTGTTTSTSGSASTVRTFKAGDTVYLKLTPPPSTTTTVAQTSTVAVAPPLPLPTNRIFVLDKDGALDLPYIGRFTLAGLSEDEASLRIRAEPSLESYTVDLRLLPVSQTGVGALKSFGYSLFELPPSTFAPAEDIPVPEDYTLAANDTVIVQLYGTVNETYTLLVTREGVIDIPDVGPVPVAGLTYSQMKQNLAQRIGKIMIGVKTHITMGPLRTIQVFVMGDATKPGSYTISALSTLTNALFVSGGVTGTGSLRDIQVKRQGKVITRLDLYDLLLAGDTSKDIRLKSGDVIFIPPIGRTVSVAGEVRRPAVYELRKEKTLGEVVGLAGGLLPSAYPKGGQIDRVSDKQYRIFEDIDLTSPGGIQTPVRDGDVLTVPALLDKKEQVVKLSGYVKRPGTRSWRPGMKLTDMIPSKNALLAKPDLDYVVIRRHLEGARESTVFSVRLGDALASRASSANIELLPEDEITVFGHEVVGDRQNKLAGIITELERQSSGTLPALVVNVGGSVYETGAYPLESGMRIADLLRAAGGLKEEADTSVAELTRYEVASGSGLKIVHMAVDLGRALTGEKEANLALKPRDYLIVKKIPEWTDQLTVELTGEVRNPGVYPIKRGEKLSSVIQRAGGLTEVAFSRGAVFTRIDIAQKEESQFKELADRIEAELKATIIERVDEVQRPQETSDVATSLVSLLRNAKSPGRMTIDLPTILAKSSADYDVTLMGGDKLYIPQVKDEISVVGEVRRTSTHMFARDKTVDDYLGMSGGLTEKTRRDLVYVVRADGTTASTPESHFYSSWLGDPDASKEIKVNPGDTIVALLDAEKLSKLRIWKDVSTVFGNFGSFLLGVASVYNAAQGTTR